MIARIISFLLIVGIILVLIISFTSCTSTKNISRQTSTVDSTVITEKMDSIRMLKDAISFYETVIKSMESTGIVFEIDTIYRDTGRVVTNKVIVKADGSIEAEGRIKSLNIEKLKEQQAKHYLETVVDSFAIELDKTKSELSKKQEIKVVEKKIKYTPFYWWIVLGIFASLYIREKYIQSKRFPLA